MALNTFWSEGLGSMPNSSTKISRVRVKTAHASAWRPER
jgi:hypothetical protein